MSSPNNAIQIYVRSPNSTIPNDYHITTTLEDNIASVKQKIHDTLEVQPNVEDQRLIFQGKILSDQDLIKNVLKKVDQSMPQIFHLVVKSGLTTEPLTQTITPVNQPQSSYGINSTNSFFRHRFQSQFDSSFENSFFQSAPVSLPTGPTFNTPVSQNTPVHPYLATTLGLPSQYQYVLINGLPYLMQMANPVTPNIGNPLSFTSGAAPAVAAPEPLMAQVPPNIIPPEVNGIQRNRQLAQSMWLVFRLVFFAYLFGQGASFERMVLISLVCMVVYLYQTGRLRVVRVQINQLNLRNPPDVFPLDQQNPVPIAPQNQNQQQPQQQQPPQHQPENPAPQPESQPQEPPRDALGILKVAILTFFRSIIPSDRIRDIQPEDIENQMF